MPVADKSLLERIARGITDSLFVKVVQYNYFPRPRGEGSTDHDSFDPGAAALYEATVELTFLVASAEGALEDDARGALQWVLCEASKRRIPGLVPEERLEALIADLAEQLVEDGLEKRARMVSRTLLHRDHQHDGMRVAALTAHAFGGVSVSRRRVLELLAHRFGLDSSAVDQAIQEAEASLASG